MDCIFCKIVSNEINSATIYEDSEFKVILDRFPASHGHVLIIPKKHIANIFEIEPVLAGRLFELAVKIANSIKIRLNVDAMNVLQNNGALSGQTINHFHLHLIPRYDNDNVTICWDNLELSNSEMDTMTENLKI